MFARALCTLGVCTCSATLAGAAISFSLGDVCLGTLGDWAGDFSGACLAVAVVPVKIASNFFSAPSCVG